MVIVFKGGRAKLLYFAPLAGLALLNLVSFEIFINPMNAFVTCFTVLMLALVGAYVHRLNRRQLENALLFFASFGILSFVPYELGLLTSLTDGYNLSGYGVIDEKGIIGPFQKVHSASPVLACSLLVLVAFYFQRRIRAIYFLPLLFLGMYFLFFTYVRTGLVMFSLGLIPLVLHSLRESSKAWVKLFVVTLLASAMLSSFVFSNEALVKRIKGERLYYAEDSIETYGSGRLYYSGATLDYFCRANALEQLFGIGETEGLNRMQDTIGRRIFPHNGFLFVLSANGVIGLCFFLVFLYRLYIGQKRVASDGAALARSMLVAYLTLVLLQSYELLYAFLFLALAYAYMKPRCARVERPGVSKALSDRRKV